MATNQESLLMMRHLGFRRRLHIRHQRVRNPLCCCPVSVIRDEAVRKPASEKTIQKQKNQPRSTFLATRVTMTKSSLFRACSIHDTRAHAHVRVTFDRLSELLELRRLRKARREIDIVRLSSGDAKKKRRRNVEKPPEEQGWVARWCGFW